MNHPKVIAGRHGLPSTSNVAWSATEEFQQRQVIKRCFLAMWLVIGMQLVLFAFRLWILGAVVSVMVFFAFALLQDERQILYLMLLNKPRDTSRLTQWTQHFPVTSPGVLSCACGREFILIKPENYFASTRRFATVCECGRGHFCQLASPLRTES